jgi:hypothetical protein
MEYTGQELVSYNAGQLSVGSLGSSIEDYNTSDLGYCYVPVPQYYPVYEHYYHNWYPIYPMVTEKSKIEQGFKIVGKMLEKKIITKELTIKEFIGLVNDIAELL